MEWVNQVGQWLNILPPSWIHTVLDGKEFRDNLMLRYQARTKELYEKCDGYSTRKPFTLQHTLQCKEGVLVTGRHKKVQKNLALAGTHNFSSQYICNIPIIYYSCYISGKVDPRKAT